MLTTETNGLMRVVSSSSSFAKFGGFKPVMNAVFVVPVGTKGHGKITLRNLTTNTVVNSFAWSTKQGQVIFPNGSLIGKVSQGDSVEITAEFSGNTSGNGIQLSLITEEGESPISVTFSGSGNGEAQATAVQGPLSGQ